MVRCGLENELFKNTQTMASAAVKLKAVDDFTNDIFVIQNAWFRH